MVGPEVEVSFRPGNIKEDKTEPFFVYVGVLLPRTSLAGLSEAPGFSGLRAAPLFSC